jgi:hypothetical protein
MGKIKGKIHPKLLKAFIRGLQKEKNTLSRDQIIEVYTFLSKDLAKTKKK